MSDEVRLESIRCLGVIFSRQPYFLIKAYEKGSDFKPIIDAIKDGDPQIALEGLTFWDHFFLLETVVYK